MTAYSRRWECWICNVEQETMNYPPDGVWVCDKCLEGLADHLCSQKLNHKCTAPGIDTQFWMGQATRCTRILFKRRASGRVTK